MDTALNLHPNQLHLLVAPSLVGVTLVNTFIARLALSGTVRVLDGGNRFAVHGLARLVRAQTSQLQTTLQHVHVARAFTCYQMTALLAQQPTGKAPTLVLDLLSTFADENVFEAERLRLLDQCLGCLRRLARGAPVLVTATHLSSAHQAQKQVKRRSLEASQAQTSAWSALSSDRTHLAKLEAAADHTWRFEAPPQSAQLRFYGM